MPEKAASRRGHLWAHLASNKRFWLPPFLLVTLLLVAAVLLAKGPAIVPFIYNVF